MKETNKTAVTMETAKPAGAFRVKYWGTAMVLITILGPLSYPPHFSAQLSVPGLAVFCAVALALVLPGCRKMWLLRTSKTPRWVMMLVGIAAIAVTIAVAIALLELNKRSGIRLSHLNFWIPLVLALSLQVCCAWICEARHSVRIYWGLGDYRYVPNSVAINPWEWLRFGGWIRVLPADSAAETKRSSFFRTRLYLSRIGADLFKVLLVLLAIYFISMPFWPLAVPPVPAELKAKYPVPEFQPRGNGEVEKIWSSLYPEPLDMTINETPELLAAPLYRLSKALQMGLEPDWTSPEAAEYRAWLAEVDPQLHVMAALCAVEDPPNSSVDGSPVTFMPSLKPLIDLFILLPGIYALDGDVEGALTLIRSGSRIAAYHTRSDRLVGWLVGNILSEMMTRSVVTLYARDLIDPTVVQELDLIFKEWQENRGTVVRTIRYETLRQNRFRDLVWGKQRPQSFSEKYWFAEDEAKQLVRLIRYLGWVVGNDYRSAREAGNNLRDRMEIEAAIWSDPAILQPGEAEDGLLDFPQLLFRRAFLSAILTPQMSGYYRKYFMTDATHRIGHAIAAIGAHKNTHHSLPLSLDEAFAATGIGKDFQTPYVDQVPEYRRLDAGAPDETNTYAFTLTIWGDGGRCDKGGGVSWLIVRNPAFAEEPLRCWEWKVLKSGDRPSVESQEVRLLGKPSELDSALIPQDDAELAFLGVPATLLGADSDKIKDAEKALRRFGWQEVPIPPRK